MSEVMGAGMDEQPEKYSIKAASRCFEILDLLIGSDEALTVQSVCGALDLNSNMAFRMLSTMVQSGYLEKDEKTSQYRPSLKVIELSYRSLMSLEVRRVAMPYLELMWQQFPKANYSIGVLYRNRVIVVDHIDSQNPPRTYFTPGKPLPFHATALGKVLTCELPEEGIDRLVAEQGLPSFTPKTISSAEALKEELARTRVAQIARSRGELLPGDNSNAVPIRDSGNVTVAAVSLAAFDTYVSEEELASTEHLLVETGRKISYFLGYNR
jgi:DNA-binding IclR family transcriptional regulator